MIEGISALILVHEFYTNTFEFYSIFICLITKGKWNANEKRVQEHHLQKTQEDHLQKTQDTKQSKSSVLLQVKGACNT